MQVVAKAQVMELRKFIATLELVKSITNSIFVDKSLPSLLNFAFIKFFLCSFDSLRSCSNLLLCEVEFGG